MRYKNISNKKLHGSELNPAFPTACYDDACISPGCSRSTGLLSLCVTFRSLCMESYVVTPVNSNPLQKRSLIAPCCFFFPPFIQTSVAVHLLYGAAVICSAEFDMWQPLQAPSRTPVCMRQAMLGWGCHWQLVKEILLKYMRNLLTYKENWTC